MSDPSMILAALASKVDSGDVVAGKTLLAHLKIVMLSFDPANPEQRAIATAALEYGVLLAVADDGDMDGFSRNIAQLKPLYALSSDDALDEATFHRKCHILGLNLMHLLVENRLSEFHAELELLTEQEVQHPFVTYPIRLERQLMVGSYDEALRAATSDFPPSYELFVSNLAQTVRDSIADCLEVAYNTMSLRNAASMMRMDSVEDLKEYIAEFREDWIVQGDELCFQPPPTGSKASDVPSLKLIKQSLSYATELERIV